MRYRTLVTGLFLGLAVFVAVPPVGAQLPAETEVRSLDGLVNKTGWVPLGGVTFDRRAWTGGHDPASPFMTGTYRIVGRQWDRRAPLLPDVGDRIELMTSVPVRIVDFATTGETRRLLPPSEGWNARRDETGLRLLKGSIVIVCDLHEMEIPDIGWSVWARVCPSE